MSRIVLRMDEPECTDARLTGGKGSSLAYLANVPGVSVPPFFVVTSAAFVKMFDDDETRALIAALQKETNYPEIDAASKRLRQHLRHKPLPVEVEREIVAGYADLCKRMGQENASVAVRSSATTEDLADASFAGQHSTYLNQRGAADVVLSCRKCWASVFNSRAAEYRNKHSIGHLKALLCVVVQAMIEPVVAGTGFSCELATGFPGSNVSALWGLGEGLVSGDITADDYLFSSSPPYRCIRRTMGSKTHQFRFRPGASGIELVPVPPEQQREWCVSLQVAREIAAAVASIHDCYTKKFGYEFVDTELAVARVAGALKVFFLQCRAIVPIAKKSIFTVEDGFAEDVILAGRYSLPGAVVGRINVVNFEALSAGSASIAPDDIVVAVKTGNAWTPFLKVLRGLITEEGSATSHPMLIGRERGIVCLVACPNAVEILTPYHGQLVTLDGLQKKVFIGEQKLKSASAAELQERFLPPPPPVIQSDDESRQFLRHFSKGFLDANDAFWSAAAEHALSPFWATLLSRALEARSAVWRRVHPTLDTARLLCSDVRVEPDPSGARRLVYERLLPLATTMQLFEGVDPERVIADRERVIGEYVAACMAEPFSFARYCAAYVEFFAHKSLSWQFRTSLEHAMARQAAALGVSQMHLDLMLEVAQASVAGNDLDLLFYREIARLAAQDSPDRRDLERAATEFKALKSTDISEPLAAAVAALEAKVKQRRLKKGCDTSGAALLVSGEYSNASESINSELFLEEAELHRAVRLCVAARRQHCNSHHLLVRGQWKVRALLEKQLGPDFWKLTDLDAAVQS